MQTVLTHATGMGVNVTHVVVVGTMSHVTPPASMSHP